MIYLSTKNEHGLDGRALRSRRGIGVRVSFQSRELNILTEHVPDALKQSAMPKRAIEEVGGCGSIGVRAVGEVEEGYLTRSLEKLWVTIVSWFRGHKQLAISKVARLGNTKELIG